MKIEKTAITGNESHVGLETPYAALVEFYDAFNHRNLQLMEAIGPIQICHRSPINPDYFAW